MQDTLEVSKVLALKKSVYYTADVANIVDTNLLNNVVNISGFL